MKTCAERAILRAYRTLRRVTPISADCGQLCNKACCRAPEGMENDYGMLLFPGEERLLRNIPGFTISKIPPPDGFRRPVYYLTCTGRCDRKLRPLSCRIFPLLPYIPKGSLSAAVVKDPRAVYRCPLVYKGSDHVEPRFYLAVAKTMQQMIRTCPAIRQYMASLSRMQDAYRRFV